jgi:hypothetical protein
MTTDRLDRLYETAKRYGGPISVAVYVTKQDEDLRSLMRAIRENSFIRKYVDIHLLFQLEKNVRTIIG